MEPSIKSLQEERAALVAQSRKILDSAGDGSLNSEQRSQYDKLEAEIDALTDKIEAKRWQAEKRDKLARLDDERPVRQTNPNKPARGGDGPSLELSFGRAGKVTLAPGDPLYSRATHGYASAFRSYLMGEKRNYEKLGLTVGNDPKGGYLVPMSMLSGLLKFLDDDVTLRRIGTVLPPTDAKSVGVLSFDTDYADADWTPEITTSDISEDDAARFGRREMTPHGLSKLVKASKKLVRSSTLPLETFISQRLAYKFGITENKAFLTGSGSQRPLGVFTASSDGITTSQDVTMSSTTAFTADDLIDAKESLKDQYQMRSTWLFHRDFRKRVRKLKDGNGNYIWGFGLQGQPDTLLERPVVADENAPNTFTTGQYIAVLGDFSFYWIQDGVGMEIQLLQELFALKGQVGWVARKETDAMPVLAEAFRRLKLA